MNAYFILWSFCISWNLQYFWFQFGFNVHIVHCSLIQSTLYIQASHTWYRKPTLDQITRWTQSLCMFVCVWLMFEHTRDKRLFNNKYVFCSEREHMIQLDGKDEWNTCMRFNNIACLNTSWIYYINSSSYKPRIHESKIQTLILFFLLSSASNWYTRIPETRPSIRRLLSVDFLSLLLHTAFYAILKSYLVCFYKYRNKWMLSRNSWTVHGFPNRYTQRIKITSEIFHNWNRG